MRFGDFTFLKYYELDLSVKMGDKGTSGGT